MIQLNIITKNEDQANRITDLLHEHGLVVNEYILKEVVGRLPNQEGKLTNVDEVLIVGVTKALLFNTINKLIRVHYPKDTPIIYAVPIVYMDEIQTQDVISETAKI
ncbi:divalent cation tolerance protein CutA [Psychroserpens sp. Hel_I_66]|uniref:divalent cation tolerance protein CutA n=1 Tax=Psychroserpens sp. Hel_I_66 TaxID=1250004 RepID=UPI000646943A|nr:divalent cation tolerance protein CutA [Psychroserpens sp. Hel_I_66]